VTEPAPSTKWREVWGISAILVALGIGWSAYSFCQPRILIGYGLSSLAPLLLIAQGALGIVMEPLMGAYSDRLLARTGSRFVAIALGVTVAGVVFVSVAAVLRAAPPPAARILIPPLMVIWLAAMNAIRTPTFALLRQAAPTNDELPRAAAVLTLVSATIAAAGPLTSALLDRIGDSPTFIAGGVLIALAALSLRRALPPREYAPAPVAEDAVRAGFGTLLTIFGVGLCIALLLRAHVDTIIPRLVQRTGLSLPTVQALWAFVPAVLGLGAAALAKLRSALFVLSLGLVLGLLAALNFGPIYVLAILGGLAAAAIGAAAAALVVAAASANAGVGVGAYFAGASVAFLIVSFARVAPAITGSAGAVVALILARRLQKT
jgi:hypothetical protein